MDRHSNTYFANQDDEALLDHQDCTHGLPVAKPSQASLKTETRGPNQMPQSSTAPQNGEKRLFPAQQKQAHDGFAKLKNMSPKAQRGFKQCSL
jgi:hypothetical protein